MTGLILLIVAGLWLWACVVIVRFVLRRANARWWRWPLAFVLFSLLLVLPVIDEIIGGFQFRSLCEKSAVLKIDAEKARGKMVRLVIDPSSEDVPGVVLTMYHSHFSYRLVSSDEEVARYDSYVVKGGLFIRTLGISESNSPLTMRSSCSPPGRGMLDLTYGFTLTN